MQGVGENNRAANAARIAARQAGEPYYRSGNPCRIGHVNPRRKTSNARCRECEVAAKERYREKERATRRVRDGLPTPTRPEPDHCECCSAPRPLNAGLCLDHDHETGAFRGWLCMPCNVSIGHLGDNIAGLERGITYLKRSQQ